MDPLRRIGGPRASVLGLLAAVLLLALIVLAQRGRRAEVAATPSERAATSEAAPVVLAAAGVPVATPERVALGAAPELARNWVELEQLNQPANDCGYAALEVSQVSELKGGYWRSGRGSNPSCCAARCIAVNPGANEPTSCRHQGAQACTLMLALWRRMWRRQCSAAPTSSRA